MISIEDMRINVQIFPRATKKVFVVRYLNGEPNAAELIRITERYAELGFFGCRGSVDCMLLHWKSCPSSLKGLYHNSKVGKLCRVRACAITTLIADPDMQGALGQQRPRCDVTLAVLY